MKKLLISLLLMVSFTVQARDLTKQDIKACTYMAGVAREVQSIRNKTGHDFNTFVKNLDKIYKKDAGYKIIYSIAYKVYEQVPPNTEPTKVFNSLFDYCITLKEQALDL